MTKKSNVSKIDNIRHSLAHLLAAAVLKKFPNAKLGIGPVIENGFYYDFLFPKNAAVSDSDLKDLEKEIKQFIKLKLPFSGKKITAAEAKKIFSARGESASGRKNQPFKLDLIKEFVKDKKPLTIYKTGDIFTDLCKGGHVKNTGEINPDAFKLTHLAGAYWRGSEKNPQLTRIYGVAFNSKKELEKYLWQLEEAKKRDHRVLGERLKLFTFAKEVGPGLPLWLPNGTIIREEIEKYAKNLEKDWGYERVATPHIAKEELYRISGHIPYYQESMYPPMKLDDGNYYLKAMNCPHTHLIYKSEPRSYRDLPLRYAEFGTVYRYELSGTLAGLLRVRGMTQNDAHIYCREDQVEDEFLKVMKLHEFWYKKFDIKDFYIRFSLPTKNNKKYAGLRGDWEKAVKIVKRIMKKSRLNYIEAEDEAAFYGPKADFQIKSVIGREETLSTNQLDFLAAKRFGLTYIDKNNKEKPVYVIHRAPLGSHERFIAFLIEHYAGAFPFWLAPIQVAVLPVSEKFGNYAEKIHQELRKKDIRAELMNSGETLGKRIREAELQKIPYIIVIGEKEAASGKISIRQRGKEDLGQTTLEEFLKLVKQKSGY